MTQNRIGHLLKRPIGRPPHEVRRYFAGFSYQAQSWKKSRRVAAKVEIERGGKVSGMVQAQQANGALPYVGIALAEE